MTTTPHPDEAMALLRQMLRIRRFEERCVELYSAARIRGFVHLYIGEEAVATGVSACLEADDAVVATYRDHGHALAKGVPAPQVMAEMYGSVEGCSRGRGGSMHLFDAGARFYGGNAIVAGGIPIAVGLALADSMQQQRRVTACFFGEGAMAEGEFHESINLAALWNLPVLFCCENNFYAMGTALERSESETELVLKAASYGVTAWAVDGMDVMAVRDTARRATEMIRGGGGPVFLELRTYRFRAHSMYDPELYRDKAEVEKWKERDPIDLFVRAMTDAGVFDTATRETVDREVTAEVDAAVAFAEGAPLEAVEDLLRFVTREAEGDAVKDADVRTMSYREALRLAMSDAMRTDARVFLMGEDVGRYGGCFAVSKGMLDEFGEARVRDTPLSESGFVGAGIGAALGGMRPIVEIMTVNFSLLALDQIMNNAATLLHMSGGQLNVPIVIRMTTGAGRQLAAQHSHSLEGWLAHIPGIRVVAPATVPDAYGMMLAALDTPDPVLLFEHGGLYNASGELPSDAGPVDLDHAIVRRAGTDVSLFCYGGMLPRTLDAAAALAELGISAEVVDLRTLRPLDTEGLVESVSGTHRAVVVDEGWRSGGISAEIATRLMEHAFYELDAPIERVCSAEVPIPYAKHLEDAALPSTSRIVAAAQRTLA